MTIEIQKLYVVRQSFWDRLFRRVPDICGATVAVMCKASGDLEIFTGKIGQPEREGSFKRSTDGLRITDPVWQSPNPDAVFVATFNGVPIPKATA